MPARIFKQDKTAMQSGLARTKLWGLEYEPETKREIEPYRLVDEDVEFRLPVELRRELALADAQR